VLTVHDLIEDQDRNLVLAVVVDNDKVPSHNIVLLAEPPDTSPTYL
jgi:hypothetical protein